MRRPNSLKEAVERARAGTPLHAAVGELLDEFYTRPVDRQAMIDEPPPLIGRPRDDAWIGGVGEHLARRWGLRIPGWVEDERRFLASPYFVDDVEHLKPFYLAESPLAFRRRLVFTELEPLRRARFPRESRIALSGD